jgi:hypothetical protein
MKQFITEFGENFSKHMKQRLLELGARCVLIRNEESYCLDIKHIEHIKYNCDSNLQEELTTCKKEYSYGQFIMNKGSIYFSETCSENTDTMQAPVVKMIYDTLDKENLLLDEGANAKKIDDENIDFMIDRILEVCPELSPEHLAILSKYK